MTDDLTLHPEIQNESFNYFSRKHPVRRFCIFLTTNKWFRRLTICVIFVNCVLMTVYNNCDAVYQDRHGKCKVLLIAEYIIFAYYLVEMITKLIALGVLGPNAYLDHSWNCMDSCIVIAGFIELVIINAMPNVTGVDNLLTFLKILRIVLRPMRIINLINSMRIVAGMMIETLPMLTNVILLCTLLFAIFGLVGVQLWKGLWRARCTATDEYVLNTTGQLGIDPIYLNDAGGISYICSLPGHDGLNSCHEDKIWNSTTSDGGICKLSYKDELINWTDDGLPIEDSGHCIDWYQYYNTCAALEENPFSDSLSFDNIFLAWLTIFVVITTEGWTDIMYITQDASSFWAWIYFVSLIVIGSIFTMNLFLVVLTTRFSSEKARSLIRESNEMDDALNPYKKYSGISTYEELLEIKSSSYAELIWRIRSTLTRIYLAFLKVFNKAEYQKIKVQNENAEQIVTICTLMEKGSLNCNSKARINSIMKFKSVIQHVIKELEARKGGWKAFQHSTKCIVNHSKFSKFILLSIVINTFFMALEGHGQPEWLVTTLEVINYIFTVIFALEMSLKIIGLSPMGYLKDLWNLFDATIVIASVLEIIKSGSGGLSVLRAFRLLRLIKLVRYMPTLMQLFNILATTMNDIAIFLALLGLVIFLYSLTGKTMFGERLCLKEEDATPCNCTELADPNVACFCERSNFDTFLNASLTVFQVLTTEDWNQVLFACMSRANKFWAVVYFVSLFFVGHYVMMNLVVAILVQKCMESTSAKKTLTQTTHKRLVQQKLTTTMEELQQKCNSKIDYDIININKQPGKKIGAYTSETQTNSLSLVNSDSENDPLIQVKVPSAHRAKTYNYDESEFSTLRIKQNSDNNSNDRFEQNGKSFAQEKFVNSLRLYDKFNGQTPCIDLETIEDDLGTKQLSSKHSDGSRLTRLFECMQSMYRKTGKNRNSKRWDYSFFLFAKHSYLRKNFNSIVCAKWFEIVILFIIVLNCITMTMERPRIAPESNLRVFLDVSNQIFILIFLVEMLMKCIAWGVIFNDDAYLKNGWNILDGFLVVSNLASLIVELLKSGYDSHLVSILRVLRLLRAFRPLRMIHRITDLKLTVLSLVRSVKDLGNILLICATFFLIFGILGVQILNGKMYFCEGPNIENVTTMAECLSNPLNMWKNARLNFDNLKQALLTLFIVSTLDGWVGVMHAAVDAVGDGYQPKERNQQWRAIYFVVFIIVMSFLIMNMVIGVLVDNYYEVSEQIKAKEQDDRDKAHAELSKTTSIGFQIRSRKLKLAAAKTDNEVNNYGRIRLEARRVIMHDYFRYLTNLVIFVNMLTMSTDHYQMSANWKQIHKVSDIALTVLFTLEAVLKIYACTVKGYFSNGWNQIAFLITLCSVAHVIWMVTELPGVNSGIPGFLRMFRLLRVFELLRRAKGFMTVMNTLTRALPQVSNLGILLGLELFIFSAIGVELFGRIRCSPQYPCEGLDNNHAHFKFFGMAFLTLFRVATGDNWSGIFKDTMKGGCDWSDNCVKNCCVSHFLATMFFILHVLLTQFILMNIVVAVLMKGFEASDNDSANQPPSSTTHYSVFSFWRYLTKSTQNRM